MKHIVFVYLVLGHFQKGKSKLDPVVETELDTHIEDNNDNNDNKDVSDAWDEDEMNLAFSQSQCTNQKKFVSLNFLILI